ncbi:Dual specificity phosphatase, catalytic domain [Actinokineospora alba]|uniref:Dual specificity phosphatase, catalytic domain n=1 Tax=Actinokineospora alba TaxID=504798 RepID=A0A1H0MU35_9PSEU|nr:dual specificity protein phosphatase family protein [Actinokineospora alba]TDP68434.1 dual specificity protein phosphatase-like protein [Actinokineospora alba]SDH79008.1 Dual specificity phosphatase, catalytic domain [Actinokineospora alba]SDO83917.1 Dual specificity phosphatase, catalytic domain [Actinokineospora alba]
MPTLYRIAVDGPGHLSTMAKPSGRLADELNSLVDAGIEILVCAMPEDERELAGLDREAELAVGAGLTFVAIPITDFSVPDHAEVRPALVGLADRLSAGANIAVHCWGGIGRSSLLAAAILVLTGVTAENAWARVESARGRPVPETAEQRNWITLLDPR